jgi:hypothetical protein
VTMTVMKIRHVNVTMHHWLVPVPMRMRFSGWIVRTVLVVMVFIVTMAMIVFQGFVKMAVLVVFRQMQPHAKNHQQKRGPEKKGWHFVQEQERKDDADKRRRRKIRTRPCGTQITQSEDKTGKADPIAKKAKQSRAG